MTVFAISTAKNNSELIVQAHELGYLRDEWVTFDPTYGLGKFWTKWRPQTLIGSDLNVVRSPIGRSIDFTDTGWDDNSFDAVVLDPPYKLNGTSTGKGSSVSDHSYGVEDYRTWQDRHRLIRGGITESLRVLKPGGLLLVKCQDQVCSGQKRWQTREFAEHAETLGRNREADDFKPACRLVDQLHLMGHRKQPPGRRQVHAQQNFSTLMVFRKAKK